MGALARHEGSGALARRRTTVNENDAVLKRLKRIEGQVRGLQKMVEQDRDCADVLTQLAAVEQALSATGKVVLKNRLQACVSSAVKGASPAEAEKKFDEIVNLFGRHWR
ncbi:MAG: metal-sensitive transcriptional regulator [Candidatus Solibacter sp.]|nr:metal-sensitive transcriptional regulator [Candidatus Solibacter sp.]